MALVISPNFGTEFADVVVREGLTCLHPSERALTEMISSDVYAQVGTFKVCPWGASDYAEILQAAADGLQSTVPVNARFATTRLRWVGCSFHRW